MMHVTEYKNALVCTISGYPSDGIVQVEEEEEAGGESDDHDTYTIEDEYSTRARRRHLKPPSVDNLKSRNRARRQAARGAPLMEQRGKPTCSQTLFICVM